MRIAVLEAVCAGLCGADPPPSLLAEGLAMWRALIDDLIAVPNVVVESILCRSARDTIAVMPAWKSALACADAAWIIAPESDKLLERLVAAVPAEHTSFNATPDAIRLCADKLALA